MFCLAQFGKQVVKLLLSVSQKVYPVMGSDGAIGFLQLGFHLLCRRLLLLGENRSGDGKEYAKKTYYSSFHVDKVTSFLRFLFWLMFF